MLLGALTPAQGASGAGGGLLGRLRPLCDGGGNHPECLVEVHTRMIPNKPVRINDYRTKMLETFFQRGGRTLLPTSFPSYWAASGWSVPLEGSLATKRGINLTPWPE